MFALIIFVSICIDFAEHAFILGFSVLRAARGAIGIVGCVLGLGGIVICARVVSKGGVGFEGCLPIGGSMSPRFSSHLSSGEVASCFV